MKLIQFSSVSAEPKIERNDDINPYWIEDKELKKGPVAFISPNERQFWVELIDKYLYPIDNDKAEQVMSRTFEKPLIIAHYLILTICQFWKSDYPSLCLKFRIDGLLILFKLLES